VTTLDGQPVTPLLLQSLLSGLTVGAIYALVALGFSIVYNATHVINFAQGEFVMLGGMATVFGAAAGLPLPAAAAAGVALAVLVGLALERLAIRPARGASVVSLIIITVGASIALRGLAGLLFDKNFHSLPPLSGDAPILLAGAALQPQSLWILGATLLVAAGLWAFFGRSRFGKAMLATAFNPLAARLVGIDTGRVVLASFGLAAALGALGGILIAPVAPTHFQVGTMLGLKGFAAAVVGGLGSGPGAIAGGLLIGVAEALSAGFLSSAYKDATAFVLILAFLALRPQGLLGRPAAERA
jgi:branched-chain amino acid transport system permease protein